jgi:hypothetical protein
MMTLAMHELSHNLGAKGVTSNRLLAIMANLPMGIPAAASFKRYHMEHHKFQGEDIVDVDIPTDAEGWFFRTSPRKVVWCLLQPLFYSLRPLFVNPKEPTRWEFVNIAAIVAFDAAIVYLWGMKGLMYLVLGTLFGMGLHPVAGHFIAEHYVMHDGQETYSYYGPLNWLTFNVGEWQLTWSYTLVLVESRVFISFFYCTIIQDITTNTTTLPISAASTSPTSVASLLSTTTTFLTITRGSKSFGIILWMMEFRLIQESRGLPWRIGRLRN